MTISANCHFNGRFYNHWPNKTFNGQSLVWDRVWSGTEFGLGQSLAWDRVWSGIDFGLGQSLVWDSLLYIFALTERL